jgi:hypothetical protein
MTLVELVADILSIQYEKRLLISDTEGFMKAFDYTEMLVDSSYNVVSYDDIEAFRLQFENEIRNSNDSWAVIVSNDSYIPYDIRNGFYEVQLSLNTVFPKLDKSVLRIHTHDLDIIGFTYGEVFADKLSTRDTERFISETIFSTTNVKKYLVFRRQVLVERISLCSNKPISYSEWIDISRIKASVEVYAARAGLSIDLAFVDEAFVAFALGDYSKLSGQISSSAPTILPKVFDYVAKDRVALIVMDGMSMFDFNILSRHFDGIEYELQGSYALIPSMTAISRQSLLSGKYPRQLENPFSLSREEKEFYIAAAEHGYTKQQAAYVRGYDVQLSPFTKLLAVIINDVDDIVHGQQQGRPGMFNDITLLAKSGRLQSLIRSLYKAGFTVYLTSDHGNTLCRGIGARRNAGVEVETKAKRMLILKDFAHISDEVTENTVEYPAYYLDKNYKYLICKTGVSFDSKNSEVMTHGGITLDEVIVPFIKIKAVD